VPVGIWRGLGRVHTYECCNKGYWEDHIQNCLSSRAVWIRWGKLHVIYGRFGHHGDSSWANAQKLYAINQSQRASFEEDSWIVFAEELSAYCSDDKYKSISGWSRGASLDPPKNPILSFLNGRHSSLPQELQTDRFHQSFSQRRKQTY